MSTAVHERGVRETEQIGGGGVVAVDLFCGAGGLTHGLRKLGIDVRAGYDLDADCAYPYEFNNAPAKFFERDIRNVTAAEVKAHFPRGTIKVLVGCAPCTPFSALRKGQDTSNEPEYSLLAEFGRLVEGVAPDIVSMENVPQVVKHDIFIDFQTLLTESGYSISSSVVKCEQYGIPQRRRRLVLLASRFGGIPLLPPTHPSKFRTVQDAIAKLPPITAGERVTKDPTHWSAELNPQNLRRIRVSKPGGTWRDWPPNLRLECHKRASGSTYDSVYGRMEWEKPAPPITTKFYNFGSGRFGHPVQDRALSVREGAILQTFPRTYQFTPPGIEPRITKLGMLIGNAVPPRLGELVGASIRTHVSAARPKTSFPPAPVRWRSRLGPLMRSDGPRRLKPMRVVETSWDALSG